MSLIIGNWIQFENEVNWYYRITLTFGAREHLPVVSDDFDSNFLFEKNTTKKTTSLQGYVDLKRNSENQIVLKVGRCLIKILKSSREQDNR